ncbi:30S ribosomal protein S17 [Enterobacteriaceae bacterium ET-AT1-13]|nr:30S ribosomal protein S17 [Enterobacteriaceae bacterium ET-AT1-13]WGS66337.1 30S ribosomal protein S17 [Enterobacteriaceae bacterium Cmel17]WMC17360.1 MAG: 30S ribosomal protein S17 [Enterobacteriaceae bacterium Cmel21]WMC17567.1 MAG: 30S ribosomal protein S17 [Enterobacteriaceae bacterium PSmelAO3-2]WMC17772.1 MAG: 30S ribosomal protein S17 [Enterobacteriaceae bacterium PSmelAO3-1]WMC17975.1 MAG: 30S ribosomal protein S17 [Enterobacteriaceae bacterium PSmelAO1]
MKKDNTLKGIVTSNKMIKSIVVVIKRKIKHTIYKKFIKKTTKFYVHDENNNCNIGDLVEFKSTTPLSKKKFWILVKILKKNYLK